MTGVQTCALPILIKKTLLIAAIVSVTALSGCTNWQKKYKSLDVEHQNLKGLYDNCVASLDSSSSEQQRLSKELSLKQQAIDDLQKQINEKKMSPAEASGFTGMDVAFDASKGTITVTLENAILFEPGKASLKQSTSRELDQVLQVIRDRYRDKEIDVVGYTDSDPINKSAKFWEDNWELSAQRALSVLRYLNKKGIGDDSIRAVACGASRPVASNSSASGKAKNRRVEIVVHMK